MLASIAALNAPGVSSREAGNSATGLSGATLAWSPFVLTANAAVAIARTRGSRIAADGSSWPYRWARALGTAIYGCLALWLSYRLALRFAPPPAALLATTAIWLASSLPVYMYMLTFTAHAIAMFTAVLAVTLWLGVRDGRDTRIQWLAWGLASGFAIIVSLFNTAFLIVALVEFLARLARRSAFRQTLINGVLFLAGAVAVVVPALAIRRQADGGWLTDGHSPVMHWTRPALAATAVSPEHGAFLWTPILLAAALGLFVAIRRQPLIGGALAAAGAAFTYLVAACAGDADPAFGGALLLPLTPLFVCGLASLVDACAGRRGRIAWTAAASAALFFVLWNLGLMLQWGTGLIPDRAPLDLRQAAANQLTTVPRAAKDFVIRYASDRKALVSDLRRRARE